jgi:hypothetical protein
MKMNLTSKPDTTNKGLTAVALVLAITASVFAQEKAVVPDAAPVATKADAATAVKPVKSRKLSRRGSST